MKASICKIMVGVALVLSPVKAMYEEEALKFSQAKLAQHSINIAPQMSYKEDAPFETFPDELFVSVFGFLDLNDLGRVAQVCTGWKRVTENSSLWRYMGARYYGDYLSEEDLTEDPKQKVIYHYLSVIVNTTGNLKEIEKLVSRYRLDLYAPSFKKYIDLSFLFDLVTDLSSLERLIVQGNGKVIKRKIEGLVYGRNGYEKDLLAAIEFNEFLVAKGDPEAIKRKIEGRLNGTYGYKKDPIAAREFNELFVEKGDREAIHRKIKGLLYGTFGYEKDLLAARELNELLAEKGNQEAIERKIEGLTEGKDSYEKNPTTARELNEFLVAKGDLVAIRRKIKGLTSVKHGIEEIYLKENVYGYDSNRAAARELNESLIEKGDPEAIERKIEGLSRGGIPHPYDQTYRVYKGNFYGGPSIVYPTYGYEKNSKAAKEYLKFLIVNNPITIYGMNFFSLGGIELSLNREIFGILMEGGNRNAIREKIESLSTGRHGYEKNPIAAREFVENLIMSEIPHVRGIGKYIKAFAWKYGASQLGYEREYERAIEFIKQHHIPY